MARNQVITCDAPDCGNDLAQGDGHGYHLMVQGTRVPIRPGTEVIDHTDHPTLGKIDVTRHDAHDVIMQHHFCDFECLGEWCERQRDERYAAQETHKEKLVANAQLLADETAALPPHLRPGYVAAAEPEQKQ